MIYYVDQAAPREGDGSQTRPFKRIGQAAQVALPGDQVLVLPGVYRENVSPRNGGTEDHRIIYRSVEPLGAIITGAEPASGWVRYQGNVWTLRVDNGIFGSYNPYTTEVFGDWYFAPSVRHTGAVYFNDRMLYEAESLEACIAGEVYTPSWEPAYSVYQWYSRQEDGCTVLYANFQDKDPNREKVEINVRWKKRRQPGRRLRPSRTAWWVRTGAAAGLLKTATSAIVSAAAFPWANTMIRKTTTTLPPSISRVLRKWNATQFAGDSIMAG